MQKNDRRIVKNFILNAFYNIIQIVTPLITSPYLSQTLGKEGLGEYQYTFTVAGYFAVVCILGVNTYGVRECAGCGTDKRKRTQMFWEIYAIQFVMSILSITAFVIYAIVFGGVLRTLLLIQLCLVLSYAGDITWLFYGVEEFGTVVVRNLIVKIGTILMIFLAVHDQSDVGRYCAIMAASALASQLSLWPFSRRYIEWRPVERLQWKQHVRPMFFLFLPLIGIRVYSSIDKLMLGQMIGMDAVGLYGTAKGIASMPYGIITALTLVMMPRMSALGAAGKKEASDRYRKITMQVTMMMAFPVCFGLAAASEKLIPWYLAEEFSYCATILKYAVFVIVVEAWSDVIQKQYIIPLKRDSVLVKVALLTAVFNLVFNFLCIPRWGIMGAVWGTLLSEAFVMGCNTFAVRDEICVWEHIRTIVPYLLFSVIMYFCVKQVGTLWEDCSLWVTLIQVITGVIVYGVLCGSKYWIERRLGRTGC